MVAIEYLRSLGIIYLGVRVSCTCSRVGHMTANDNEISRNSIKGLPESFHCKFVQPDCL